MFRALCGEEKARDTMAKLDEFSMMASPLTIYFEQQVLATGTCFAYVRDDVPYLVTNWHNLAGRNPMTNAPLSKSGGIPNRVSAFLPVPGRLDKWNALDIPLFDKDGIPCWFEHPKHGNKVDIGVLPLLYDPRLYQPWAINKAKYLVNNMLIMAGMDVFVLGFPFGIAGCGAFPIWKRASLATEPELDYDDLPKIMIDTATRPGMSGSPVICRKWGWYLNSQGGTSAPDGTSTQFVGVYSGRIGAEDELKAQLGIVWKAAAVDDIIVGRQRGVA